MSQHASSSSQTISSQSLDILVEQRKWVRSSCALLDDNLIALKHHISLGLRDREEEEGRVEVDIMSP